MTQDDWKRDKGEDEGTLPEKVVKDDGDKKDKKILQKKKKGIKENVDPPSSEEDAGVDDEEDEAKKRFLRARGLIGGLSVVTRRGGDITLKSGTH